MDIENSLLYNGVKIPSLGFGTYPLNGKVLIKSVGLAVNSGYRLFDTSDNYYNHKSLGVALEKVINKNIVKREDLFITTKLSDDLCNGMQMGHYFWKNSSIMQNLGVKRVIDKKIEQTLIDLKTDYIDLLLLHWPYPDYYIEAWEYMIELYKRGLIRAIGICNCRERHIEEIKRNNMILPMVNQFETSPLNTKQDLINYCDNNNIRMMVYSPLMSLKVGKIINNEVLLKIAERYNKSIAQVLLRWNIQRGLVPIPKSSHKIRIKENIDVFDFKLAESEIGSINLLNENYQYIVESLACPGI